MPLLYCIRTSACVVVLMGLARASPIVSSRMAATVLIMVVTTVNRADDARDDIIVGVVHSMELDTKMMLGLLIRTNRYRNQLHN